MAITSVQDRYNELIKAYQPSITDAVNKSNAAYKGQSDVISQMYQTQIDEQGQQYDKLFDQNEVQRYINEQRIAENMANSGLTDSGLNRTQQTAVQLSYANNNAEIGRQRQSAVNALTQAMTAKLADIESARANAEMNIKSGYEQSAMKAAQDSYNADVSAAQKAAEAAQKIAYNQWKAQLSANTSLSKEQISAAAKSKKEDVLDRYIRNGDPDEYGYIEYKNSAGKTVKRKLGENPYTGKINADAKTNGKYDPSKTFSNGYQPNNIGGDRLVNTGAVETVKGNEVTVWQTSNGSLWVWDGENNRYRLYDPQTRTYQ